MTDSITDPAPVSSARGATPDPESARRVAWLVPGVLLAVGSLFWGTHNVLSLLAHEETTTTSTYALAEVDSIDVATEHGSIRVIAGDVDEIVVTADISSGWKPADVSERIVDGVLELRGSCSWLSSPWCSIDFTVTAPPDVALVANGGDGSVTVRGVTAPIDVDTDDGSITLEDVAGTIRATNDNGRITGRRLLAAEVDASTDNGRVELSFVDPPTSVRARTQNGRIVVAVPDDDVLYRVEMDTNNGSTDNGVRTDPSSDRVLDLATDNGSITVERPG